jgi:Putative Actinobacterial Holin-X, holin superfamily III
MAKVATEELLALFELQIRLARLELSVDLRQALRRAGRVALLIPPLVVGYAFGMAALASWLGKYWSRPAALASIAALQIVPAGLGILWSVSALGRTQILERTRAEVTAGVRRTVGALSEPARRFDV